MSEYGGHTHTLRLLGERLCLNFANTVDPRHSDHPRDFLTNYADLVAWAQHVEVLTDQAATDLRREAAWRPEEAEAVFTGARLLRQAMYRIFAAIAAGESPTEADLELLNNALVDALAHVRVVPLADSFVWSWIEQPDALDQMLWPIARSAADLLTSGQLKRVRECPGEDGCGWLFFDTSKNGSRRWCSMEGCGNRAKTSRFRTRQRTGDAHSSS